MKIHWIAALAFLAVALTPGTSFAQKKVSPVVGKACLTAKETCSAECNSAAYCQRMICLNGKWKKTVMGCVGALCPPKC